MRLPVLMYHDITPHPESADFLTIPAALLERQLWYIRQQGYTTISLRQFHQYLTKGTGLPSRPLLLTFDDGYRSNFSYLYPLLQQYQLKASIFLVTDFVNSTSGGDKYLQATDLHQMEPGFVEYGYHSYSHSSYGSLSIDEMNRDLQQMKEGFGKMNIPMVPLFAYPYGASPRKEAGKMLLLQQAFKQHGIDGAFRIGNRLNALPTKNNYQIQRIDVRGTDSFWKFKLMLRFGRKWIA